MLQISYFDVMAKGLPIVAVLQDSGLAFERVKVDDWGEAKKDLKRFPFQQLPVLVDDEVGVRVAQCTAIVSYIGQKAGRNGKTPAEQAMNMMLIAEAEDIYSLMQKSIPTLFVKLGTPNRKGDVAFLGSCLDEQFPRHLKCLDELLRSQGRHTTPSYFSKSDTRLAGEMYLWGMLHQLVLVFPAILDPFVSVSFFYKNLKEQDAVKKVIRGESAFGSFKQYFLSPADSDLLDLRKKQKVSNE